MDKKKQGMYAQWNFTRHKEVESYVICRKKDCRRPALTKMPLTRVGTWGLEKQKGMRRHSENNKNRNLG